MRILLLGAGGVGSAFCSIASRRDFFDHIVVSDYDESRAGRAADAVGDGRFSAARRSTRRRLATSPNTFAATTSLTS
jgi:saccharopine dehydrogenase-like NADP-dependent oxidoreductase